MFYLMYCTLKCFSPERDQIMIYAWGRTYVMFNLTTAIRPRWIYACYSASSYLCSLTTTTWHCWKLEIVPHIVEKAFYKTSLGCDVHNGLHKLFYLYTIWRCRYVKVAESKEQQLNLCKGHVVRNCFFETRMDEIITNKILFQIYSQFIAFEIFPTLYSTFDKVPFLPLPPPHHFKLSWHLFVHSDFQNFPFF